MCIRDSQTPEEDALLFPQQLIHQKRIVRSACGPVFGGQHDLAAKETVGLVVQGGERTVAEAKKTHIELALVALNTLTLHVHFALGGHDGFDVVGLWQGAHVHIVVHHQELVFQVCTAEPVALHLLDAGGIPVSYTHLDVYKRQAYSRGMGGMGIPGDLSSQSRFVKVAFTKLNSISGEEEDESVSQFFHILGSVDQQRGCCEVTEGKYEITIYTSCCNTAKGIYYYTTYDNHQITAVDMHAENLDSDQLICYQMCIRDSCCTGSADSVRMS